MRVTDLTKFSLEQIWRPYQDLAEIGIEHNAHLTTPPLNLELTAEKLLIRSEWSRLVLRRIDAMGVHFPTYITHPLVDVVLGERSYQGWRFDCRRNRAVGPPGKLRHIREVR